MGKAEGRLLRLDEAGGGDSGRCPPRTPSSKGMDSSGSKVCLRASAERRADSGRLGGGAEVRREEVDVRGAGGAR